MASYNLHTCLPHKHILLSPQTHGSARTIHMYARAHLEVLGMHCYDIGPNGHRRAPRFNAQLSPTQRGTDKTKKWATDKHMRIRTCCDGLQRGLHKGTVHWWCEGTDKSQQIK